MKKELFKLIIPISIISFIVFTKWWYVSVVDTPNSIMIGFPLAYSCNGWHTSMSQQFFLLEFIFDFIVYLVFWTILFFAFDKLISEINSTKVVNRVLIMISSLLMTGSLLLVCMPENLFFLKRDFDIKVIETKPKFLWQIIPHPESKIEFKSDE